MLKQELTAVLKNRWWKNQKNKIRPFAADNRKQLNLDKLVMQRVLESRIEMAVQFRNSIEANTTKTELALAMLDSKLTYSIASSS